MSKQAQTPDNQLEAPGGISRRDMLLGMGAVATMAYAGSAVAAESNEHVHVHDHSKHATQLTDLMDAVNACNDKGRRCISHCMVSFTEGDMELAECASKAQEMLSVCGGFAYLVASNSSYIKDYAQVCEKVCSDCAKECRKHDKHIECDACAKACDDVVDAIKLSVG
ncbi:MAG: Csp1 family four helix bundle copper storage protein [Gammaproteobacteria bacterium]|jgi:Cys-rich four helix bundle protein (predicted Tat secretion target)|nr:Csp1 family four helix bundle copper storage protein [Gammaproteobacteria bacterium]